MSPVPFNRFVKPIHLRKSLEVSFWNEWKDPFTCGDMSLVASMTWSRHGRSHPAMSCRVTYNYDVLGKRVGVIDPTFFRPAPIRNLLSLVNLPSTRHHDAGRFA